MHLRNYHEPSQKFIVNVSAKSLLTPMIKRTLDWTKVLKRRRSFWRQERQRRGNSSWQRQKQGARCAFSGVGTEHDTGHPMPRQPRTGWQARVAPIPQLSDNHRGEKKTRKSRLVRRQRTPRRDGGQASPDPARGCTCPVRFRCASADGEFAPREPWAFVPLGLM
jgi:hypothetical protein